MSITIVPSGERYREVIFVGGDDDAAVVRTGLLNRAEAAALAEELRDVADKLARWTADDADDPAQEVLPFFGGIAA